MSKKNPELVVADECQPSPLEFAKVLQLNKNIFLFGEINVDSTGNFMAAFAEADSTPGPITIHICSPGGWVEGGMAMYDTIKSSNNKVITIARGTVCSSAVLPYCAGDVRLSQKSTRFLLHDMSVGIGEMPLRMIKNISQETTRLYEMYCKYVGEATGQDPSEIDQLCRNETYMSSESALEHNLVNKIIEYNKDKFDMAKAQKYKPRAKKTVKAKKNVRKR